MLSDGPALSTENNGNLASRRTIPLAAHAINELDAGRTGAMFDLLEKITAGAGGKEFSDSQTDCMNCIARHLIGGMPGALETANLGRANAYRDAIGRMLVVWRTDHTNPSRQADLIFCHTMLSELVGKSDDAWRKELPERRVDRYQIGVAARSMEPPHLVAHFLGLDGVHGEIETLNPLRWRITRALLKDDFTNEVFENKYASPLLRHFLQHRVLTPDEVVAHAEELAGLGPANRIVAVETAETCLAGGATEKAIELAQSFSEMPEIKMPANRDGIRAIRDLHLRAAKVLFDAGELDSARAIFETTRDFGRGHGIRDKWIEHFESLINNLAPDVTE